jgi:redox-sensing transcriptional repressor
MTDVNPAQIRRDLTHFGQFGRRGIGYDILDLIDRIQKILGSDHTHRIALVGAGNLGSAIANYNGLRKHGFVVTAIFDQDPAKVGSKLGDIIIEDVAALERTVSDQLIRIGIIAVPPEAAQAAADRLCAGGVSVILNYSPTIVSVPGSVLVHNTDPVQELLHTLYYLSRRNDVAQP